MPKYSQSTFKRHPGPFESDRFILTPLGPNHEPGMFEMFSDLNFTRYVPFEHFSDREASKKDFLEKIKEGKRFRFHYAVEWKDPIPGDHNMAGFAMIRPTEDGNFMEIGYCVVPRFWGQGAASEITRLLVEVVGPKSGAKKTDLIAKISLDNGSSIRVAEKCGFKFFEENQDPEDPTLLFLWRG